MIRDYDRSHYFGASDGLNILSPNTGTKTYRDWWAVKCGLMESPFHGNIHTMAGNTWEHSILKTYDERVNFDRQIIHEDLRLRVNYDGDVINGGATIIECKTHKAGKAYTVTEAHWYQAQIQIFAWNRASEKSAYAPRLVNCKGKPMFKRELPPVKRHVIISYPLTDEEKKMMFNADMVDEGRIPLVDERKIKIHEIKPSTRLMRRLEHKLKRLASKLEKEEIK